MPSKAPTHPLSAMRSMACSSTLEQRRNDTQRNPKRLSIIICNSFLNRGSGTLKVSSMNTTSVVPASWSAHSCCSTLSISLITCGPASMGYWQNEHEKGQLRAVRR